LKNISAARGRLGDGEMEPLSQPRRCHNWHVSRRAGPWHGTVLPKTPSQIEFVSSKLAESRDRLKKAQAFANSLPAGSAECAQVMIDDFETLQQVLGQLCQNLRGRPH
jgi:hypothetical protein